MVRLARQCKTFLCFERHGRSAVSILSRASGALGEHPRQDNDGISPEIAPPGCRSSVRRSTEAYCPQPGQENVSQGSPAAIAAPIVG
jgi:hypothetical protein